MTRDRREKLGEYKRSQEEPEQSNKLLLIEQI